MTDNAQLVDVLNDLILINNDRIVGYEKALKGLDGPALDLRNIFTEMAGQSREYVQQLSSEISDLGGEVSDGTTNSGKIYRAWMDIKATFSGDDRQTALNNCEFGEDAAQKAYKDALNDDDTQLSGSVRQLITDQKSKLKVSHDKIKAMRDANKEV